MEPVKTPAWKTTKFWIVAALTNAGLALASGLVLPDSQPAQIVGWLVATAAALGYAGWKAPETK